MKRTQTFEKLDEIDAYFEDIKKYRPLSSREEKELAVKIRKGDKAALAAISSMSSSSVKFFSMKSMDSWNPSIQPCILPTPFAHCIISISV